MTKRFALIGVLAGTFALVLSGSASAGSYHWSVSKAEAMVKSRIRYVDASELQQTNQADVIRLIKRGHAVISANCHGDGPAVQGWLFTKFRCSVVVGGLISADEPSDPLFGNVGTPWEHGTLELLVTGPNTAKYGWL